jgi:hypothetical protein
MLSSNKQNKTTAILAELDQVRTSFHASLDSFSKDEWHRQSLNPGWTNNEIFAHMLFGFIVLNALLPMARAWGRLPKGSSRFFARFLNAITGPFNWINKLGARMQGKVFTYARAGKLMDHAVGSLAKKIEGFKPEEWSRGMYYPTRWDANFSEFMTLEKLVHYPIDHYYFHLQQLSRISE